MRAILFALIAALFFVPTLYGETNNCLEFDGANDYAQIPDSPNWAFSENDFTIEAWLKFNSLSTYQMLYTQIDDGFHYFELWYAIPLGDKNDQLIFAVKNGTQPTEYVFSAQHMLVTDHWYHIAMVHAENEWTMYQDGAEVGNTAISYDYIAPDLTTPLTLGGEPSYPSHSSNPSMCFNGSMDELRIWDRARTQQEIDYWKNSTLYGSENGLLGYWNFDDPNNIMKDLSPYGNNGQVYGAQYIESDGPVSIIPEPASMLLFGIGGAAMALIKRKKRVP